MEAKDLRIGNYHYYHIHDELDNPKDYEVIDQIDADDLKWLSSEAGQNDEQYQPIPLTEDWLKRFGFEFKKGRISEDSGVQLFNDFYDKGKFKLNHWDNGKLFYWDDKFDNQIQYVHQLQNLYFALTGEELKLREE